MIIGPYHEENGIKRVILLFIVFLLSFYADTALGDISYPRIANFYGANLRQGMPQDELDFLARYSLIVVGDVVLQATKELSYIKSKNPNLLVLYYISVRGVDPNEKSMQSDFWLRDPAGRFVSPWPGRYLPNQTLQEVNDLIIAKARNALNLMPKLDGIFLDSFTQKITYLNNGQLDADRDGIPDEPQKLNEAWDAGLLRIARGIRAIRSDIIIMANGWAPLTFAYDALNGVLFEDQLNRMVDIETGIKGGSPTITDDLLAAYLKWQSVPNVPHVTAFVDGGGLITDPYEWAKLSNDTKQKLINDAQNNNQRMRLNLCFSLMGDGYAAFDYGTVARGQKWWFPEWDIKLGAPVGSIEKAEGYWLRKFEYGVVYVNPYPKSAWVKHDTEEFLLSPFDGKIIWTLLPLYPSAPKYLRLLFP